MFNNGVACGSADDDDDPPCATDVDTVCGVEKAGDTGTVVCSANLLFFMFGSASETGHTFARFRDSCTEVHI